MRLDKYVICTFELAEEGGRMGKRMTVAKLGCSYRFDEQSTRSACR